MHTHPLTPRALTLSGAVLEREDIPPLETVSLKGLEAINALFEYTLVVQTPEREPGRPRWEINGEKLLGQEITVHLELEGAGTFTVGAQGDADRSGRGAGWREISGVVAAVRYLDADERHLKLELILRPGVWEATLGSHHHAFHDMTVIEVVDAVLEQHPWPVDKRLSETYPTMDRITQWGESDWRFCCRLMQQCGINHHFEHSGGTHRLVLSDRNTAFKPFGDDGSPYHRIPIHPPGHRIDREYIHAFATTQQMVSTIWEARDHDYSRPRTEMRARLGEASEHSHARREVYQWRVAVWARENQAQDAGDQDSVHEHAQLQQKHVAGSGEALGELTQPHLVMASAAGIASTATGSTHQASNAHHAITSGAHTSVSAGGSLLVAARHAVRMFAGKLGMRLVAAAGDIDIRALSQSVHVLARLEITETAEVIRISASKQLEVSGGGSYGRWNAGGIEFGSAGPLVARVPKLDQWSVMAGAHGRWPDAEPLRTWLGPSPDHRRRSCCHAGTGCIHPSR